VRQLYATCGWPSAGAARYGRRSVAFDPEPALERMVVPIAQTPVGAKAARVGDVEPAGDTSYATLSSKRGATTFSARTCLSSTPAHIARSGAVTRRRAGRVGLDDVLRRGFPDVTQRVTWSITAASGPRYLLPARGRLGPDSFAGAAAMDDGGRPSASEYRRTRDPGLSGRAWGNRRATAHGDRRELGA
jgi:hypothetical protein